MTETPNTVTKTGWASVRPEDAIVGRTIQNYQPRVREYDPAGDPLCDSWIGVYVKATIIETGAYWSIQRYGTSGYHVRVQFEVPSKYANTEFV